MSKKTSVFMLIIVVLLAVLLSGCGQQAAKETSAASQNTSSEPTNKTAAMKSNKITLGHTGGVCEAPFFMAYEKGFFKEEGLDVTLVQGDGNFRKEGVATGKLDATDSVLMGWMMPFVEGMDIKITTGIHTGCMDILVPVNSAVKSIKDLKGKTIGVSGAIGSGAHMYATGAMLEAGLSDKDVTWKAYPNPELIQALAKGEIDAIASPDTLAETWIKDGKVKMLSSMAMDAPFNGETCCHLVVNGERLRNDPEAIRRLTNAVIKGAKWVNENKEEAVEIMLAKKYTQGDKETNLKLLNSYNYNTDNVLGKKAVTKAAERFVKAGILPSDFDKEAFLQKIYVDLPGLDK